jgi:hypothetical protein
MDVFSVKSAPRLYNENPRITDSSAILDKAKLGIESIRGLNLAEVKHTTVQVIRQPL